MKLDSRIIEGKRPLTCFDAEDAKQFIGKEGFFTNELNKFSDLNEIPKTTLKNVWPKNETYCFITSGTIHKYFLPCEWVKESEKKYRPFTHEEFTGTFNIGEPIIFRRKQSKHLYEYHVLFIGCCFLDNDVDIVLGNDRFSLKTLFNNYEWRQHDSYEWQAFGVPEE